jgi:hypothetical protein
LCADATGGLSKYIQLFRPIPDGMVVHYGFHLNISSLSMDQNYLQKEQDMERRTKVGVEDLVFI